MCTGCIYRERGEKSNVLYSRLPLLVSCYRGNRDALETVVRHLTTHKRSVETRRALKFNFLMVHYLRYPESSRQLLVLLYHVDERVLLFVDHGNAFLKSLVSSSPSIPCKVRPHTHSHTHTLTLTHSHTLTHSQCSWMLSCTTWCQPCVMPSRGRRACRG